MLPNVSVNFVKGFVAAGLIVMIATDLYKGKIDAAFSRFVLLGLLVYLNITVKVEINK